MVKKDDKVIASTNEMCELLNVSRQTLIDWVAMGCPKFDRGQWDVKAVFIWRNDKLNEGKRKFTPCKGKNVLKVAIGKRLDDFKNMLLKRIRNKFEGVKLKIKNDCGQLPIDSKLKMLIVNSVHNYIDEVYTMIEKEINSSLEIK